MMNFLLRAIFFLMGLVFAASLAVAALLLAAVWGLRYLWARLTGKPVAPWVMRFDPRAGFGRFQQREREPSAADVANARARGDTPGRFGAAPADVTDVSVKSGHRG